jgi:hypothetical protein
VDRRRSGPFGGSRAGHTSSVRSDVPFASRPPEAGRRAGRIAA